MNLKVLKKNLPFFALLDYFQSNPKQMRVEDKPFQ